MVEKPEAAGAASEEISVVAAGSAFSATVALPKGTNLMQIDMTQGDTAITPEQSPITPSAAQ